MTEPSNWTALWKFTIRWARRPVPGVLAPVEAGVEVGRAVMKKFVLQFPEMPPESAAQAWLETETQRAALAATAATRAQAGNESEWHDGTWEDGWPALSLAGLRLGETKAWQSFVDLMRRSAPHLIRRAGVPDDEVEDVFSECLAELDRERPEEDGVRMLDRIAVFEQAPRLFGTLVKRRAISHLRTNSALKNLPHDTRRRETLHTPGGEARALPGALVPVSTDAPGAGGLDFATIYEGCSDVLSDVQWTVVTRLFMRGETQLEVVSDPAMVRQLGLEPKSSEATRRRRLQEQLGFALAGLARCLKGRDLLN